jgi:hypothetical protein
MPSVTVGKPKDLRHGSGFLERGHHAIDERLDAGIARIHRGVTVRHANDRLLKITVSEAHGAQHGAVGGACDPFRDELGTSIKLCHLDVLFCGRHGTGCVLPLKRAGSVT